MNPVTGRALVFGDRHDAWIFYRSERPLPIEARPAGLVPEYAAIRGFTPSHTRQERS
jgi:hypothetical protein